MLPMAITTKKQPAGLKTNEAERWFVSLYSVMQCLIYGLTFSPQANLIKDRAASMGECAAASTDNNKQVLPDITTFPLRLEPKSPREVRNARERNICLIKCGVDKSSDNYKAYSNPAEDDSQPNKFDIKPLGKRIALSIFPRRNKKWRTRYFVRHFFLSFSKQSYSKQTHNAQTCYDQINQSI